MSFQNLNLSPAYDTGLNSHDIIQTFYNPLLAQTVRYDRVAGYFSSRVLASAARGIAGLVSNGGRMRLLTSHAFTPNDTLTIKQYFESEEFSDELLRGFRGDFSALDSLAGAIARNHLGAMCWMLREGFLEIKVVIPKGADLTQFTPEEIEKFHPKYGILYDEEENIVAFTGSINETESAWKRNIENLDFYASWEPGELERRIQHRIDQFENIWNGQISDSWTVLDLPVAVKDKIIRDYAPKDFPKELIVPEEAPKDLRPYQQAAVDAWKQNDFSGMLVMATGTGKTRTAKACIEIAKNEGTLLTVVVVPYQHIGDQWLKELGELNPTLVGGNRATDLAKIKTDLVLGRMSQATLVVVKETAGKSDFVETIRGIAEEVDNALLVSDEVHWLGAAAYKPILDSAFNFRLGLSATPKRHFDEDGTDYLMKYFSGVAYDFPISEALKVRDEDGNPILCPYEYHPEFVDLSEAEKKQYKEFSKKIARTKSIEQTYDVRSYLESLYLARARIIKSASSKIPHLRKILEALGPGLKHCLIYCADKEQLKAAADILNDLRITAQQITGEESTNSSPRWNGLNEREFIIENFARAKSSVLLAIRCLDEGVDIPAAEVGIILASSGNSKEFIQRRGRLMRPYRGKEKAVIYDLCVMPDPSQGEDFPTLRENEMNRIREFAADALNTAEIDALLDLKEMESAR